MNFIKLCAISVLLSGFAIESTSQSCPDCWTTLSENFESGTLDGWITETNNTSPPEIIQQTNPSSNGTHLLSVPVTGGYGSIYKTGLKPITEGYVSFWFNPNNVNIPDTNGTLTQVSFRFVSIYNGNEHNRTKVAALRIRQKSTNEYIGYLEYPGYYFQDSFAIENNWQKITLGFKLKNHLSVWLNNTLVIDNKTVNTGSPENVNLLLIGKDAASSLITPSGNLLYDDIQIQTPSFSDIYVDAKTGNDTLNSGITPVNPFKTIQKAVGISGPGTTVHIAGGTYTEGVKIMFPGDSENPVRFIADTTFASGGKVIIDGTGIDSCTYTGLFFLDSLASHIIIENIHLINSPGYGFHFYYGEDIHLLNCSTCNTHSSGIKATACKSIQIKGNDIQLAVNGGSEECIALSATSDFEVSHNTVHNGAGFYEGGEGICVKGNCHDGSIHHNRVYDLPKGYDPLIDTAAEVGIYIGAYSAQYPDHLYNIDVYCNDVSTPIGIAEGPEVHGMDENVRIYNNIVHDCFFTGIQVTNWMDTSVGNKKDIYIVNNTVYNCGHTNPDHEKFTPGGGIYIQSKNPYDKNIVVRNNIVCKNSHYQIGVQPVALDNTVIDHNVIYGNNSIDSLTAIGDSAVLDWPDFVDEANLNLRLRSGSPAIDAGSPKYAPLFDFDSTKRPQNGNPDPIPAFDVGAFDIGAFEYVYQEDPPFYDIVVYPYFATTQVTIEIRNNKTPLSFIITGSKSMATKYKGTVTDKMVIKIKLWPYDFYTISFENGQKAYFSKARIFPNLENQ